VDILIKASRWDYDFNTYYEHPENQPHPLAVQRVVADQERADRSAVITMVAKINDAGEPYIDRERSWEYPKGWFESGRDHQEKDGSTVISRTVDRAVWVVTVNTLEELEQLMGDPGGELLKDWELGIPYTLRV